MGPSEYTGCGGGEEGGAQLLAASQHLTAGADADDATTSSCLPEPPRRTEADARPSSSLPVLVFSLFSPSPLRLMTNPARPLSRPSASTSPFSTSLHHTGRTPDHSAFGQVHMTFQTGKLALQNSSYSRRHCPPFSVSPGDKLAVSPAPKVGLTWQTDSDLAKSHKFWIPRVQRKQVYRARVVQESL